MEKNTYVEMECKSGKKLQLTLSFYRMYQLKNKNKKAYEECNRIMIHGAKDVLDNAQLLYSAYLCANTDNLSACMNYEKFLQELQDDWGYIGRIAEKLVGVKKKRDSDERS